MTKQSEVERLASYIKCYCTNELHVDFSTPGAEKLAEAIMDRLELDVDKMRQMIKNCNHDCCMRPGKLADDLAAAKDEIITVEE